MPSCICSAKPGFWIVFRQTGQSFSMDIMQSLQVYAAVAEFAHVHSFDVGEVEPRVKWDLELLSLTVRCHTHFLLS